MRPQVRIDHMSTDPAPQRPVMTANKPVGQWSPRVRLLARIAGGS